MKRCDLAALCAAVIFSAAAYGQTAVPYQMAPMKESGQGITGAFEGWFKNPDGTFSLLLGYFNRNTKQELDIPIGPRNSIEPGGPNQGQPTHFLPGRQWGLFTVTVPQDFGTKQLTWTLTANGQTNAIPLSLNSLWEVSPFREEGVGNTPPFLSFEKGGRAVQGPRPIVTSLSAAVDETVPLNVWVTDDAKVAPGSQPPQTPPVTVTWSQLRGAGKVTFANAKPPVSQEAANGATVFSGRASTTATFSELGAYVLHVTVNDWSGEGGRGFQCCWTNGEVKVMVNAGPTRP